uniref:Uncharacterized protein n=1 Tax=Leersia perrieri TaxID=77586 RepID=A0A0D9XEU6_9ORYZ
MASSSHQLAGGEIILAASHGRPITAYDALSGHAVAEFPSPAAAAINTSRHGLAAAPPFVAASHVCPATGAGSVLLLHWRSRAPPRQLQLPEPVAPLVAAPLGSHLLAGGISGRVHAVSLPSGHVSRSFPAHVSGAPVSCLVLNDDCSLLVSGGYDGEVAVFALATVLDADADEITSSSDLAIYRIPAHAAPVSCVACGGAVVATASMDGTCKLWSLNGGAHLRTIHLPCTLFSIAVDRGAARVFAGGADGRVHVASSSTSARHVRYTWHASATGAAIVGVGMANGGRNLIACTEDGEASVWDIATAGGGVAIAAGAFRIGGVVTDVAVIKKSDVACDGHVVRAPDVGVGFRVWDGEELRKADEVVRNRMEERLKESEVEKRKSVELIEMAVGGYKRCLRLMVRELSSGSGSASRQ